MRCGNDTLRRWPLHPRPYAYETLALYVRRLAAQYGVGYGTFCLRALGIPIADGEARSFSSPAPEVLARLSAGTGIPVAHLEQMTVARTWQGLLAELDACMATPEGRAWVEQMTGTLLSRNSYVVQQQHKPQRARHSAVAKVRCASVYYRYTCATDVRKDLPW